PVSPGNEKTVLAVTGDETRSAPLSICGDNRAAGTHRLGQHLRVALLVRGKHERPGTGRVLQWIIDPANCLSASAKPKPLDLFSGAGPLRPLTHDEQARLMATAQVSEGVYEQAHPLPIGHIRGVHEHRRLTGP